MVKPLAKVDQWSFLPSAFSASCLEARAAISNFIKSRIIASWTASLLAIGCVGDFQRAAGTITPDNSRYVVRKSSATPPLSSDSRGKSSSLLLCESFRLVFHRNDGNFCIFFLHYLLQRDFHELGTNLQRSFKNFNIVYRLVRWWIFFLIKRYSYFLFYIFRNLFVQNFKETSQIFSNMTICRLIFLLNMNDFLFIFCDLKPIWVDGCHNIFHSWWSLNFHD